MPPYSGWLRSQLKCSLPKGQARNNRFFADGTAKNQRDGRGIAVHHQGYMGNQHKIAGASFIDSNRYNSSVSCIGPPSLAVPGAERMRIGCDVLHLLLPILFAVAGLPLRTLAFSLVPSVDGTLVLGKEVERVEIPHGASMHYRLSGLEPSQSYEVRIHFRLSKFLSGAGTPISFCPVNMPERHLLLPPISRLCALCLTRPTYILLLSSPIARCCYRIPHLFPPSCRSSW